MRTAWRWVAGATLLAWLMAFGLCTTHCAFGMTAMGAEQTSASPCHSEGASDSHSTSDRSGAFCITFRSLEAAFADITVHPPQALALFQQALGALSAAEMDLVNSPQLLSQSSPRDFLWTPEVYLGPAHLPQGPPISAEPTA